uniref:Uncharacterized protein n=1 Tax=Anguilla anguilla TaxID=7936 RepID=A0A0E9UHU5_ANGAN
MHSSFSQDAPNKAALESVQERFRQAPFVWRTTPGMSFPEEIVVQSEVIYVLPFGLIRAQPVGVG